MTKISLIPMPMGSRLNIFLKNSLRGVVKKIFSANNPRIDIMCDRTLTQNLLIPILSALVRLSVQAEACRLP